MKKQILILALLLVAAVVQAQDSKNFIDQNYIEVTGVAYKEVVPDEIYLTVEINEKDNKGKESLAELERKMFNRLEELGIKLEEQVTLNDIASNFQFYFLKRTDIFSTKEYTVKLNSAALAGDVINGLSEIGISNISIDRVAYSKEEELKMEVKLMSIKNAKDKAKTLVNALDRELGSVIHIQDYDNPSIGQTGSYQIKVRSNMAPSLYGSRAAQNISFDKLRVNATIQVKFAID